MSSEMTFSSSMIRPGRTTPRSRVGESRLMQSFASSCGRKIDWQINFICIHRESNPELGHGKTQCYRYTTNAQCGIDTVIIRLITFPLPSVNTPRHSQLPVLALAPLSFPHHSRTPTYHWMHPLLTCGRPLWIRRSPGTDRGRGSAGSR